MVTPNPKSMLETCESLNPTRILNLTHTVSLKAENRCNTLKPKPYTKHAEEEMLECAWNLLGLRLGFKV